MEFNKKNKSKFLELLEMNPFVLAPMESITNLPYRELFDSCVAWTVSEMLSADALIRGKVRIESYIRGKLRFNVIQLFGNDERVISRAAKILEESKEVDAIDLNFGCPSSRIVNNGMGSALLKNPKKIYNIVKAVKESVKLPVSAKIRLGFDKYNYKDVVKQLEQAGVDLIVVHGRIAKQGYLGNADWKAIKEIASFTKVPIVGNGDVTSEVDFDKLVFVDGLMIGRASMGKPFFFKILLEKLRTYEFGIEERLRKKVSLIGIETFERDNFNSNKSSCSFEDNFILDYEKKDSNSLEIQKKLLFKYIERAKELNLLDLKDIKVKANIFLKGVSGAKKLRMEIIASNNVEEVIDIIKNV